MIKALIFDFDGLILDTETLQYTIFQQIFHEYNVELPFQQWVLGIGSHSDFSLFEYLRKHSTQEVDEQLIRDRFRNQFHLELQTKEARNGVKEYLAEAKQLGLKIGLASSSNYQWVSSHLKNLHLFDFFECIKTADDVEHVKPNPALYLKAAECLNIPVEECLVFEDSANGALAAKRAGMSCVVIHNTVTENMNFCEVEYRLSSMSEMNLKDLLIHIPQIDHYARKNYTLF